MGNCQASLAVRACLSFCTCRYVLRTVSWNKEKRFRKRCDCGQRSKRACPFSSSCRFPWSQWEEQAREAGLAESRGEGNGAAVNNKMGVSDDVDNLAGPGAGSPTWMQHHRLLKGKGLSSYRFPLQARRQLTGSNGDTTCTNMQVLCITTTSAVLDSVLLE